MSAGSVLTLGYGPSGNAGKVLRLGYGPSVFVPPGPQPTVLGGNTGAFPEVAIDVRYGGTVFVRGGGGVFAVGHIDSEQLSPAEQAFLLVMLSD